MVAAIATNKPGQTVTYWPRGASAQLFREHGPEVLIAGPAGTGKTYGALWRVHLAMLKYAGARALLVRKVGDDLTASALVTYQQRVLGSGRYGVRAYGGSKLKPAGFQYPNGSEVLIGGMDKPEKVMSREYDLVYANEAPELEEEDWENLTTRVRWGVMPYQQVFGDANPRSSGHWLYKRYLAGKLVMLNSVHEDNPALYDAQTGTWTEQGAAYIAKLDSLSGYRRDRLRDGLWVAAEGVVYPAFNREKHVKSVECGDWRAALALDVGTRNPTALLTFRFGSDRAHQEREFYERGLSSDTIVDTAVAEYERVNSEWITVDPSAAGIILSLQQRGLYVIKANNEIKTGIARVTSMLDDLTIDPSCVNTIDEYESYRYPGGARSENDNPLKENDHCLIAGTMVDTEYGKVPIERIRIGFKVWTRDGLRPVVAAGLTNHSVDVYTLVADDGRTITGSSQHPIWTDNRGWVMLDDVRYGDILATWNHHRLSSTASRSDATRWTGSANAQQVLSSVPIWTRFDLSPLSGTDPKRAENGIAATVARLGRIEKRSSEIATNAALSSSQSHDATTIDSAPTTANRHGVARPALMTRIGRALSAGRRSASTDTLRPATVPSRVVSVTAEPVKQAVYNLTVAGTPEFFANGILVHNSMDATRYFCMTLETHDLSGSLMI